MTITDGDHGLRVLDYLIAQENDIRIKTARDPGKRLHASIYTSARAVKAEIVGLEGQEQTSRVIALLAETKGAAKTEAKAVCDRLQGLGFSVPS